MANELPPVLVTFDLDSLMTGKIQAWRDYHKVGPCYVPEVVFQEIEFLADGEGQPEQEELAKEFLRFFPESGWTVTDAQETHPSLTPAAGNQSQRAKMIVATAQCVYGFSQENPQALVVFVSNSQPLQKRMLKLGAGNLCVVTAAMLLNWARKGERPPAATQQLQSLMRQLGSSKPAKTSGSTSSNLGINKTRSSSSSMTATRQKTTSRDSVPTVTKTATKRPATKPKPSVSHRDDELGYEGVTYRTKIYPTRKKPNIFFHLLNGLGALFFLMIATGIVWKATNPVSFNQFWQKNVAPNLPQQVMQWIP